MGITVQCHVLTIKRIHSYPSPVPPSCVLIYSSLGDRLGFNWQNIVHGNHRSAAAAWVRVITECTKYIHWEKRTLECINRKMYDNNPSAHKKLIFIK